MAWMKWIARWFGGSAKSLGSLGIGLKAALSGGAPGGWASDHREETAHNTGFNYIAVHAIAAQVAGATVTVFADGNDTAMRQARRKFLAMRMGTFTRWKSTYGADDRETNPLPTSHPLVRLMKRPNPYESGANFRYRQAQQVRLTGTCLIWNVPSIAGPPCERYVIPTAMASPVAPTQDLPRGGWRISPVASRYTPVVDDGFVDCPSWYRILGQIIDARQVQVIRLPHAWYLDDGQSPLSAGAKWVDAGEAVDEARFHQLKNGIDPSIVWNLPPDVSPDQDEIDRVQAKISAKYGGPENVGRVMVAQSGTLVTPLSATPKEMCFTEGFHDFKAAVLALHQTPPVAVGLQEPGAYAAYNASMKAWRHAAVQPLCDMLAESDTEHLAPHFGSGLTVEIESDTVDDAELLEQQLQNDLAAKVRTKNEWRAVRGMPPLPGPQGDELVGTDSSQSSQDSEVQSEMRGNSSSEKDPENLSFLTESDQLPRPLSESIGQKSQGKSDNVPVVRSVDTAQEDSPLNGSSQHDSHDRDARRRAELIADILYGIYGDSALQVLEGRFESVEKAFDPALHPRDAQGRFTPRGTPKEIAEARELISKILSGNQASRDDEKVLKALWMLTVEQLELLHKEYGVTPLPRLRAQLIESLFVRLIVPPRICRVRGDAYDLSRNPAPSGVRVYLQQEELLNQILKQPIKREEWGHIVGAQPGARVYVYPPKSASGEYYKAEIYVVHPDYVAHRAIWKSSNSIKNETFEVQPNRMKKGIATRVLSAQVESASNHGFRYLEANAEGVGKELRSVTFDPQSHLDGYIVWPILGYDGPIAPLMKIRTEEGTDEEFETVLDFKKRFKNVKNVSEMMLTKERRDWWTNFGGPLILKFDLRPNSPSRLRLQDHVARRADKSGGSQPGTKAIQPVLEIEGHQGKESIMPQINDMFTEQDLPKFIHPEWGENPDPLTDEQEEMLCRLWDELGRKLGIPEQDAKVREQLSLKAAADGSRGAPAP